MADATPTVTAVCATVGYYRSASVSASDVGPEQDDHQPTVTAHPCSEVIERLTDERPHDRRTSDDAAGLGNHLNRHAP